MAGSIARAGKKQLYKFVFIYLLPYVVLLDDSLAVPAVERVVRVL